MPMGRTDSQRVGWVYYRRETRAQQAAGADRVGLARDVYDQGKELGMELGTWVPP